MILVLDMNEGVSEVFLVEGVVVVFILLLDFNIDLVEFGVVFYDFLFVDESVLFREFEIVSFMVE